MINPCIDLHVTFPSFYLAGKHNYLLKRLLYFGNRCRLRIAIWKYLKLTKQICSISLGWKRNTQRKMQQRLVVDQLMVHILLRSKDRYSFGVSIHFSFFKCIFYVDLWSDIIANKCMLVNTSQLKKLYWFSVLPIRVFGTCVSTQICSF